VVVKRSITVWLVIIFAETLHGIARGAILVPYVGDFRAWQIGVFTGSAIFFVIAFASVRWIRATHTSQLFGIGVLWLVLTLVFEVSFGRFVLGYSWKRVASDYNLAEGGLLPLGLAALTVSPYVAGKVRKLV
jgi:hypothetical protein